MKTDIFDTVLAQSYGWKQQAKTAVAFLLKNKHSVVIPDAFSISTPVVQKQKKTIKNEIKLDTNIQIKIAVNDADSTHKFIEQGYDHEKEMHFYKVYYNNELN